MHWDLCDRDELGLANEAVQGENQIELGFTIREYKDMF